MHFNWASVKAHLLPTTHCSPFIIAANSQEVKKVTVQSLKLVGGSGGILPHKKQIENLTCKWRILVHSDNKIKEKDNICFK